MTSTPTILRSPHAAAASDELLIVRSLHEPEAFDQLFERHHAVVFRYAASRVGLALADDLVGDTFLAAFSTRRRFDPSRATSALPWLLGIATKRISRARGAEQRWLEERVLTRSALDAEPAGHEERSVDRADAARLAPGLAAALASLSRRERDPLLLHVLADLTYEQVAVALDVPLGTVRSRISRAKARLGELLQETDR